MIAAVALCIAVTASHPPAQAARACDLAPEAVAAAEAHGVPADVLLAIAYRETRWKRGLVGAAGERSAWQVKPRYCNGECDADDAARMLSRWMKRSRRNLRRALAAYNAGQCGLAGGCGNGYADAVLAAAGRWQPAARRVAEMR